MTPAEPTETSIRRTPLNRRQTAAQAATIGPRPSQRKRKESPWQLGFRSQVSRHQTRRSAWWSAQFMAGVDILVGQHFSNRRRIVFLFPPASSSAGRIYVCCRFRRCLARAILLRAHAATEPSCASRAGLLSCRIKKMAWRCTRLARVCRVSSVPTYAAGALVHAGSPLLPRQCWSRYFILSYAAADACPPPDEGT